MSGKRFFGSGIAVLLVLVLMTGLAAAQSPASTPLGTGFTYQGQLKSSDLPYTGTCDIKFGLYDALTGGTQVGILTMTNLAVDEGFFTVQLDYGTGKFAGDARWLEMSVRCPAGSGTYQLLTPRQALTAAPYALYAKAAHWSGLAGVPAGFADGTDNDTTYSAGTGLTLSGTTFSANTTYLQRRVTGTCDTGNAIRVIASDGTVTCQAVGGGAGDITAVYAGTGLAGGGTSGDVTLSADAAYMQRRVGGTCTAGSAIRVVNADGTVTCESVGGGGGWSLTGNAGTTPGTNFLGTTDNKALEIKVNALRALRIEPNATSPSMIGGYSGNWLTSGVYGATVAGGGQSGSLNRVTDTYGTVGGGVGNQAGDDAGTITDAGTATVAGGLYNAAGGTAATVGGGGHNSATGVAATVAGGDSNSAGADFATVGGGATNSADGDRATVGGGEENIAGVSYATVAGGYTNTAVGGYSTIGGGGYNSAVGEVATVGGGGYNSAGGLNATVGGGYSNDAGGQTATIGGGSQNTAGSANATVRGGDSNSATGDDATVGGGYSNSATGSSSTVGGGSYNTAGGPYATIAGGTGNAANGFYATVAGGSANTASGTDSFAAGYRAKADSDGCFVWGDNTNADLVCNVANRWVARAVGGVYFYTNGSLSTGVYVAAGGGSWASVSDRKLKEHVAEVDSQALLASLARVPVTTWSYKSQDASIRHIGPMAQDFYAAFGVGEDDTHITTVDADGVALAAIQGLYAENLALKAENAGQQAQIDDLEARLTALEAGRQAAQPQSRVPALWLLAGGLVVAGGTLAARRRPGGGR